MRFYKILFSLLLMILLACHRDHAPDNLIEEDEFVPLLVDIHLADGYLNTGSQIPDSLSYRGNGLYDAIFKKHHVDSVQFRKSFQYYSYHLEQMNRIYKAVIDQLTAKNDSLTKFNAAEEMKRQRRAADSVKKVFKIDSAKKASKTDTLKKSHQVNRPKTAVKDKANHK